MPDLDQTGPTGQGREYGRGRGICGSGAIAGRGRRRTFISPENELVVLEDEEKILEKELTAIRNEKTALKKQEGK